MQHLVSAQPVERGRIRSYASRVRVVGTLPVLLLRRRRQPVTATRQESSAARACRKR